ncbi:MAG: sigma-70 family RNA polymerase sigma factor [Phycisphaeraceae bacterium]|nr:sigma-70 family RNA polymerase sigma factor [Phycisphaeraceae bacterium]
MMDESRQREVSSRAGGYPRTSWTLIERVGRGDAEALSDLLLRYAGPLRAHLRLRRGINPTDAEDLVQSFIADKVIEKEIIRLAHRDAGRFRTFLLTALDRYATSQWRKDHADKRQPDGGAIRTLDPRIDHPAVPENGPDVFDAVWARQVLDQALHAMREECQRKGQERIWELFELRLLKPLLTGCEPLAYDELVDRFGFKSPTEASNALMTATRKFKRFLQQVVGDYVPEGMVEREINELVEILRQVGPAELPDP